MLMTGPQLGQFSQVLRSAFTPASFDRMLLYGLDINRQDISLGNDFQEIVYDVLVDAKRRTYLDKLLLAARQSNTDNPDLLAFAQQFGLATATPARGDLERIIRGTNGFLDVVKWRTRLGQIENQICCIEIPEGSAVGTGFLLGPDVVMTNYHVVESVIRGQTPPHHISLRFDYKRLADGLTLNEGKKYKLTTEEWLIDSSPYSAVDLQVASNGVVPEQDELDYALLRVEGAPGNEPVGGDKAEPDAPPRKWIDLPTQEHNFTPDSLLAIMQHPEGSALKLALDSQAVIALNSNGTRVRYRTNTEHGSSGSPCFDMNWNLVALHHSGDPNYAPLHHAEYNQGIPFTIIFKLLQARGKQDLLGEQPL